MNLEAYKSFELEDLGDELWSLSKTKNIVFVSGAYDLLHSGHVAFLNKCKKLGDILVVGVNSDQLVRNKKGDKRPIVSDVERAFMVSNMKCVDFTFIKREPFMEKGIRVVNPKKVVFCKEGDESFLKYDEIIKKYNTNFPRIECVILDRQSAGTKLGNSTTKIIKRIMEKYGASE